MKGKGKILVLNGPSGVGKTTLYHRLLEEFRDKLELSISATTRAPREGELDGRDYYFISLEEFKKRIAQNAFVEWAEVYGNYYGTLHSELERITHKGHSVLLDIDVQGGESVKRVFPDAVLIFILPPSREELHKRLIDRKTEDLESLKRRIQTSEQEIEFYNFHQAMYSRAIVNADRETAYQELSDFIRSIL